MNLQRQQILQQEDRQFTFTPQLFNAKQNQTAEEKEKDRLETMQRLTSTTGKLYVAEILSQIKAEYELRDCTFKPEISPASAAKASVR